MANRANWSEAARANLDLVVSRNAQVKEARGIKIDTPGLAAFRRDLRVLDKEVDTILRRDLKDAVRPILETGRALAPRNTGALASSLRMSVTQRRVTIGSKRPYAQLIHWGGSTGRGHRPGVAWSGSVLVRPSLFLSRAIELHEDRVVDAIGDAVEKAARKAGWH